ncbi:hypothetical protein [Neorhizobium alkalisoli]|uniref:Uncharacterized protein n=1 Tax=Neorhizobium alkalisoli TaxID=528178 RepID=A0A561QS84_9HYPH|nr:hypothetical protein [Neorhizobium alkalisoli]TWF53258.1 hypothetical protein FHW37_104535 [Neorhizobium alkalisoli]
MAVSKTKSTAAVAAKAKSEQSDGSESANLSGDTGAITADTGSQMADIAPATEIDTSGAVQQIVPDVDLSHPAVDADPRRNTTADQNRIDFNDPTMSGQEAVERSLGMKKD